jgi:hypothetical protein
MNPKNKVKDHEIQTPVTSAASQAPAWVDGGAGSMFIITFSFL